MIKSELRQLYLSKQKAISREDRASMSDRIAFQFSSNFDLTGVRNLHCFIPIEKFNEVNTRPIFELLWRDHPQVVTLVPRVDFESNGLISLKLTPETALVRNTWEIDEPSHNEFVEPEQIDMVLVPGLCFDLPGHRVGYGKGFYDRFLKQCRTDCLKVGLSYFQPVETIDDVYGGDVRLDAVVTAYDVTRRRGEGETGRR